MDRKRSMSRSYLLAERGKAMTAFDPTVVRTVTLGDRQYQLNERNYLKEFERWDEGVRDWLAAQEGIALAVEHLRVIDFLRSHYALNHLHPVVRTVLADLATHCGQETATLKAFHRLFPKGIHQAYLVAGLPMQDSCC
jgi:TusE/DsrC/DsvC family sulfur relay protein